MKRFLNVLLVIAAICSSYGLVHAESENGKAKGGWFSNAVKGIFGGKNGESDESIGKPSSSEKVNGATEAISKGGASFVIDTDNSMLRTINADELTKPDISPHINAARTHIQAGDLSAAIDELVDAISKIPDSQEANAVLGAVLLATHHFDLAENYLSAAVTLSEWTDLMAIVNLAEAFKQRKEYDPALRVLVKGLELKDEDTGSSYPAVDAGLGGVYFASEEYGLAADWYLSAAQKSPHEVDHWIHASTIKYPEGHVDLQVAEHVLMDALEHNPQSAEVHNNLAIVAYHRGNLEQAIALYEEALRFDPEHHEANIGMATTYHALHMYAEAYPFYETAVHNEPTNVNLMGNFATMLQIVERYQDCAVVASEILKVDPHHELGLRLLEDCKDKQNLFAEEQ